MTARLCMKSVRALIYPKKIQLNQHVKYMMLGGVAGGLIYRMLLETKTP